MAAQNRRRSLRPATGGRPGDNNGGRPDRAERRFRLAIATSCLKVLRRPIEFTQYASGDFQKQLVTFGMKGSMSRKGDCWDNAVTETLFGSLKVERLHGMHFATRRQAKDEVIDWLQFYNHRRLHSTLGYLSPMAFEKKRLADKERLAA